jgi:hypothetical protein
LGDEGPADPIEVGACQTDSMVPFVLPNGGYRWPQRWLLVSGPRPAADTRHRLAAAELALEHAVDLSRQVIVHIAVRTRVRGGVAAVDPADRCDRSHAETKVISRAPLSD